MEHNCTPRRNVQQELPYLPVSIIYFITLVGHPTRAAYLFTVCIKNGLRFSVSFSCDQVLLEAFGGIEVEYKQEAAPLIHQHLVLVVAGANVLPLVG